MKALADEFLITYDNDTDDFVPLEDFRKIATARFESIETPEKIDEEVSRFKMFDTDEDNVVSWRELVDYYRKEAPIYLERKHKKLIDQLFKACDSNKNIGLEIKKLTNR